MNASIERPRRGRGKSQKSLTLIESARAILEQIQPATVRAVCYRLFADGLIEDMKKNSTNKVSKQLVWARENGVIPWEWIVDEIRSAERPTMWTDTDERIEYTVKTYRRDNWQDQPNWIEVWSEKGTVRGTLKPVLDKYGVSLQIVHGYSGSTLLHDTAEASSLSDKPLTILYVGDYDPSGMHMSGVDIPSRIAKYHGNGTLWRIALTGEDVGDQLPGFPAITKSKDPRYRWFIKNYGNRCWELDALSPDILRRRVETAIRELMDLDSWNRALLIERAEVNALNMYMDSWKQSISRQASKYLAISPND